MLSTVNNNRVNTYENNKNINKAENNNTNIIKNNTIKEENNTVANNINSINNVSSSNNKMDDAVRLIESKVGNRYVWGATGPNTFDCSGLVQYVYKNALGKDIPRTSYEQSKFGQAVDKKNLQVGDLVFFDTMGKGRVSHVGMYVGNNEFVHAANSKDGIKKSKLTGYYETHYRGARRP
ncbi:C40 family peptidase [Paraclostridium bifermentans]|uniref:C40 family peptidase n=1 Tax=Paraclostridium bifermentans TaxID=1490 RepID=UPI00359C4D19